MDAKLIAALGRAAKSLGWQGHVWPTEQDLKDAAIIRAHIETLRNSGERPAIVRIDPAEYQDGLYLNPVTGQVVRVEADT